MILVDRREDSRSKGSNGLWDDLKKTSLPVEQTTLDGGDLMFIGQGPEGEEVTVGLEFKKIRDLLTSIRTKRLPGHQVFKLQPYDFRYLLVEGEWRGNKEGMVSVRSKRGEWAQVPGRFSAAELDKTLLGLPLRAGIYVWPTATRRETVRWIQSLYRNFTDGKWTDHSSHIAVYRPPTLVPISDFRTTVSTFPAVGVKTSLAVERHFGGSIRRAVKARAAQWAEIDGIGKKNAQRIDEFLE